MPEYYVNNPNSYPVIVGDKSIAAYALRQIVNVTIEESLSLKDKGWSPQMRSADIEQGTGASISLPTTPKTISQVYGLDSLGVIGVQTLLDTVGHLNVLTRGARAGGTFDCRAAVQTAIDEVAALGGGTVFFPTGTYLIGSPGLNMKTNVTLKGSTREKGTRLIRSVGGLYSVINAVGIGLRTQADGKGHIKRCRFLELDFDGADSNYPIMDIRGADLFEFSNCEWIASLGTLFVCWELFDSRFWNCRWGYGGSPDGTRYATEFMSGTDTNGVAWENTNQIHFYSCIWESNRGRIINMEAAEGGFATNEMYFTNCKMENNEVNLSSMIRMRRVSNIYFDNLQICTKGTAGNTLSDIIYADAAICIVGYVSWEHIGTVAAAATVHTDWSSATPSAASVTRIMTSVNSGPINLILGTVGGSLEKTTADNAVQITGTIDPISVTLSANLNRLYKYAQTTGFPNITTDLISLDNASSSSAYRMRSRLSTLTKTGVWDLGRIINDGANGPRMRLMHNNGTNEVAVMEFTQERETKISGPQFNVTTGIAAAGTSQAGSTSLTQDTCIALVTTATAASAEGVRLPPGPTGKICIIRNLTAVAINIYPQNSGSINAGAANASVSLAAGANMIFVAGSANNWFVA